MAESSVPWTGTTTGDAGPYSAQLWTDLWSAYFAGDSANKGVFVGSLNKLIVTGAVSPVAVDTGMAFVDGTFYKNTASVNVAIPTPSVSTRIDRIVLRKTWATQLVRIARVAGVEGGGAPALTQSDGNIWEIPLAQVTITTLGAITLVDQRVYIQVPAPIVASQLWLSGRGALASLTNGFTPGTQVEMATNKQNFSLPSFPNGSQKYAEWEVVMPSDWDGGTITAQFHWLANSASTNSVVWGLQGRAYADTDTIDQAWGTAVEVTDANQSVAYKENKSALTAAITIAGTPAGNNLVKFRAYRLGSGADNLAVAALLLGIQINYTRT